VPGPCVVPYHWVHVPLGSSMGAGKGEGRGSAAGGGCTGSGAGEAGGQPGGLPQMKRMPAMYSPPVPGLTCVSSCGEGRGGGGTQAGVEGRLGASQLGGGKQRRQDEQGGLVQARGWEGAAPHIKPRDELAVGAGIGEGLRPGAAHAVEAARGSV
jgi:hypothetical protein